MRYLDPKNDLTFKKVFGTHPHLLRSFLNALLPLPEGEWIESLEYLSPEMVPPVPLLKHSIVDVRCRDNKGRQFIVEMQLLWTDSFKSRVLFNASKAYVQQLDKGKEYRGLHPVYALSLVNEVFEKELPAFYHHYQIVHTQYPERTLEGLQFIFVELPKFRAQHIRDKKLQVLWLRYLTEIEDNSETVSPDLLEVDELREAVGYLQESGFTKDELFSYDKYWDSVSTEKTLLSDAEQKGREEGFEEGRLEEKRVLAQKLLSKGFTTAEIADMTGLTKQALETLLR
ncbi:Rpn family recombination-promoting nuclease/putative transposase [Arsenicibacter rosenii]|uniref:Transposase n=1 Tax=Arsenicibacter rosenii TaxID=1750698 RepID=A0A1S2VQ50_9BACT|nr:Rpn family recombination-promoting nuclease/putative transposase [Arsenicibacter rosenii]OIN59928.1 hypothetical protein BLX24_08770 [Arsenicibacter rosenii]